MKQDCVAKKFSQEQWDRMTDMAVQYGMRGASREAFHMVQRELDQARARGDKEGECSAIHGAAILHLMRGDYWSAIAASLDAFETAERAADRLGMARAVTMLVSAMTPLEPAEHGIVLLNTAIGEAVELDDASLEARARNVTAIIQGDLEHFEAAHLNFSAAMAIIDSARTSLDRWRVEANSANLYRKRAEAARRDGEVATLLDCVEKGLALARATAAHCDEAGKLPMRLDAINIEAMLLAAGGDHAAALARFQQSWSLAIAQRHRALLPFLGTRMGPLLCAAGELAEAEAILTLAYEEARLYRPSAKGETLCVQLAELRTLRQDARGANHWTMEAKRARFEFEASRREAQRQQQGIAQRWAAHRARSSTAADS
jgi:hypothetical protein